MPMFTIETTNADFKAMADEVAFDGVDDALAVGIRGAVKMAGDEVVSGVTAASVLVSINDAAGSPVRRAIVSISVSSMLAS